MAVEARLFSQGSSRLGNPTTPSRATLLADAEVGASAAGPAQLSLLDWRLSFGLVEDADGYERSVAGISIRSMRTGQGLRPNRVLAASSDAFVATSVDVGFPMINRTTIPDDKIVVASIQSAPEGARWSGVDLRPETVTVLGPDAEHLGINPVGLSFAFAAIEIRTIEQFADSLGRHFRPPSRGSISDLSLGPHASALRDALSWFTQCSIARTTPRANLQDDVLYVVATALSDDRRSLTGKRQTKIDRRRVVLNSINYAEMTGRIPSISELCRASHVSERLLRTAFAEECSMPPSVFFRMWALNEIKRQLSEAESHRDTVTSVASGAGIRHLGRFAGRYRQLFGVSPSETLRSHG